MVGPDATPRPHRPRPNPPHQCDQRFRHPRPAHTQADLRRLSQAWLPSFLVMGLCEKYRQRRCSTVGRTYSAAGILRRSIFKASRTGGLRNHMRDNEHMSSLAGLTDAVDQHPGDGVVIQIPFGLIDDQRGVAFVDQPTCARRVQPYCRDCQRLSPGETISERGRCRRSNFSERCFLGVAGASSFEPLVGRWFLAVR